MESPFVIVGAGIGGLAAALALSRTRSPDAGVSLPPIQLLEQASEFAEIGAGLQLGPNAVRVLERWGLGAALDAVAARPQGLRVLDARDGRLLGAMPFGTTFRARHGADYLTLHRADLHGLLLRALDPRTVLACRSARVVSVAPGSARVVATTADGSQHHAQGLLACDGLWSAVRQQVLGDGLVHATGHQAYRAMLAIDDLPAGLPPDQVIVWLGPAMHAVAYPVRRATLVNLVIVVQATGRPPASIHDQGERRWELEPGNDHWMSALRGLHSSLLDLAGAAPTWKRWALHERRPLAGAHEMASGRVALLGDAAHPMRPYLAQGAAMALEDAAVLADEVARQPEDLPAAFAGYARRRWRRNARVQRKSLLNGRIFHATGVVRVARNLAMRLAGDRLLDTPWLYGHRGGDA